MFKAKHPSMFPLIVAATAGLATCYDAPVSGQPASQVCSPNVQAGPGLVIAHIALPATPLVLGNQRVVLPLTPDLESITTPDLTKIAASESEAVLLQLDCVEADRAPGATWEVYVGPPGRSDFRPESPFFVGSLAMFGDGIKFERQQPYAQFVFPIDRSIMASGDAAMLNVTFVPSSGVTADGRTAPVEVKYPVRIGAISLVLDRVPR